MSFFKKTQESVSSEEQHSVDVNVIESAELANQVNVDSIPSTSDELDLFEKSEFNILFDILQMYNSIYVSSYRSIGSL